MLNTPELRDAETLATFRRFSEIDWDFPTQASESPFSAVHWHPCRFPSQIPALTIGRMTKPGDLVLDPFMGSATTLVEAQRLGRRACGIDLNPVSCLLGTAKTLPDSAIDIRDTINRILVQIHAGWEGIERSDAPPSVQAAKWYMPSTYSDLRQLRTLVKRQPSEMGSIIARACFSSILLPACREDRHWGYVCDNTQPKGNRAPDARALFSTALGRLADAYSQRNLPDDVVPAATIINDDSASALSTMPDGQVDCVVTSPPYFGVADYVKAQRLTMEWEEYDVEPFRRREIGARSKRHRKTALEEYLRELDLVFREVHRVMKADATAVIVFGQSPKRPDAQLRFTESLISAGFRLQMERHRHIPSGRRQMPSLVRETVLVVRK